MLLILPITAYAQQADPALQEPTNAATVFPPIALTGRIVDEAELISPKVERRLTSALALLERRVGPQFVIVTVNSLDGMPIEEYGQRLGNCWGIGSADRDDGLILLVAPNERKVRIEVGLGLEAVVTDEYAADVVKTRILPPFSRGEMELGIRQGADTLIRKLMDMRDQIYAQPPADRQGLTCNG